MKILAALALAASIPALAQPADYPLRPIHILVGFTPGGGPDITARWIAQKLGEAWKQQVIVENRPGAGGTVAAGTVARAAPDGYTLLSVSSAHAVAAAIYPKLPYDTFKDLAGITETASSSYVLVTPPALGLRSVKDLIALAKAKPGQLNFASAGVGSGTHFAGEMFKAMAGIEVVHVPLKGIPESLTETVTGRVQFFMAPMANGVKLDLPTVSESGVPGYESILWFGLLTSSAVPRPIVNKLNAEITRILRSAETYERFAPIGMTPRPMSAEDFDAAIRNDVAVFTRIAREANIKAE
jgi:tripartite-type tricarboxylate transporter receptor subunit TctC